MTTKYDPSERPRCPGCVQLMKLRRSKRRTGLPALHVFECTRCGFVFTEAVTGAAPIAERASALHLEAYTAQH